MAPPLLGAARGWCQGTAQGWAVVALLTPLQQTKECTGQILGHGANVPASSNVFGKEFIKIFENNVRAPLPCVPGEWHAKSAERRI